HLWVTLYRKTRKASGNSLYALRGLTLLSMLLLLSGTRKNSQGRGDSKSCVIFLSFNRRLAWPNFSHNAVSGAVTSVRVGNSFFMTVGPFTQTQTPDTFHQGSVKTSRPGVDG